MARINLLPWRDNERKQRQKTFGIMAGAAAALGVLIVGSVHFALETEIENQQARNSYLEERIAVLDRKIKKVRELEATKERLLARMQVIQELQQNRPVSVHLMEQLVQTLPEGVHLRSFRQNQDRLQIDGVAESNARVSAYMRNIDDSPWMANPNLSVIQSIGLDGRRMAQFTLSALQDMPKDQAAAENGL